MNQNSQSYHMVTTATLVKDGVRLTTTWADALQIVKRRIWWKSMTTNEQVVATVLVGAGSLITRRK